MRLTKRQLADGVKHPVAAPLGCCLARWAEPILETTRQLLGVTGLTRLVFLHFLPLLGPGRGTFVHEGERPGGHGVTNPGLDLTLDFSRDFHTP